MEGMLIKFKIRKDAKELQGTIIRILANDELEVKLNKSIMVIHNTQIIRYWFVDEWYENSECMYN